MSPILQWMCDTCGEMLQSPRERCQCPVITTNEGGEVKPARRNIEDKPNK